MQAAGHKDAGYGSTSKLLAQTAVCLLDAPGIPDGVRTPGAALQVRLIERLGEHAGLSFEIET